MLALLEHPLLKLARMMYPAQPTECETVLRFLREQLQARHVESESTCPASDADLLEWIAAGLRYGRHFKANHPDKVKEIFAQCGKERLQISLRVVKEVVQEAGAAEPARLLAPLKRWQERVYGWSDPMDTYAHHLAQVAYFSDFAAWIPWLPRSRKPRRQSKITKSSDAGSANA